MKKLLIVSNLIFFTGANVIKVAHRGNSGKYPQNTLLAFKKALETNAQMIELDVHLTKDGELVVFHDFELDKLTNGSGKISDKTLSQLKQLKVLNSNETIPTLKEVLDLLNNKIKLDIELKGKNTYKAVADLMKELTEKKLWSKSNFLVTSFDHEQVREFHKILPEIQVGYIYDSNELPKDLNNIKKEGISWAVADFKDLNSNFVKNAHDLGLKILAYTVNTKEDVYNLQQLKIDAFATDYPEKSF